MSTGLLTVSYHPILKQKCAKAKRGPSSTMTCGMNVKTCFSSCCSSSTRITRVQTLAFLTVGCFYILPTTISTIVFASCVVFSSSHHPSPFQFRDPHPELDDEEVVDVVEVLDAVVVDPHPALFFHHHTIHLLSSLEIHIHDYSCETKTWI